MSDDPMNLTGAWFGSTSYLGTDQEDASFIANLEEVAGLVSGTMSEPYSVGDMPMHRDAVLRGSRDGEEVSFSKLYDGANAETDTFQYAGTINPEGTRVAGFWQMEQWSGGFEMTRTQPDAAELEDLAMAEEPAFATLMR